MSYQFHESKTIFEEGAQLLEELGEKFVLIRGHIRGIQSLSSQEEFDSLEDLYVEIKVDGDELTKGLWEALSELANRSNLTSS